MTRWLSLLLPALFVLPGVGCASYYYGGHPGHSLHGMHSMACSECGVMGCNDHDPVPQNPLEHVTHVGRGLSIGRGDMYYGEWRSYPPDCDTCNSAGGHPFGFLAGAANLWGHRDHESHGHCSSCAAETMTMDYYEEEVSSSVDIEEGESIMVPTPTPPTAPNPKPQADDAPGPLPGPETSLLNSPKNSRRSVAENRSEWTNNSQPRAR
jgi:hypothetical protein